jgi:uncharacterized LabA/DUF88 family protein
MNDRVVFLVDDFNLYHSIREIKKETQFNTRWLDIYSLCKSYLHQFGKTSSLETVFYFSAIPYYLNDVDPEKIQRHKDYISCLESTGIKVDLGRFKEKTVYCDRCRSNIIKHEEKETDVAIGIKAFEIFVKDLCDTAVVVTGDTDLAPAFRKCGELFPGKKFVFAFPYKRKNKELALLAPGSFSISYKQYIRYQLPNPMVLANGHKISKPDRW